MKTLDRIYGMHSLFEWENRRTLPPDDRLRKNLSDTLETSALIRSRPASDVTSFIELIDRVAFLSVMNKTYVLLFRGQRRDLPLLPNLFRQQVASVRQQVWADLELVEAVVLRTLDRHGLPRWRHLHRRRQAVWAVIQHYELWPTPLLDFTTSLRVAASFAFGCDRKATEGFLYVVGVSQVRADLMDLKPPADKDPGDRPEMESGVLAIRLNSVCPPNARRPHLQEGVLIGSYPFLDADPRSESASDAASILVAKLRLVNPEGTFWSDDYPIHSHESLLPSPERDHLLAELTAATDRLRARSRTTDSA
jgi:hypothetical protein